MQMISVYCEYTRNYKVAWNIDNRDTFIIYNIADEKYKLHFYWLIYVLYELIYLLNTKVNILALRLIFHTFKNCQTQFWIMISVQIVKIWYWSKSIIYFRCKFYDKCSSFFYAPYFIYTSYYHYRCKCNKYRVVFYLRRCYSRIFIPWAIYFCISNAS